MEEGVIDEVLEADKLSTCDITLLAVRPGVAIDFVKENQDKIKITQVDNLERFFDTLQQIMKYQMK